jgi:hypothetical protein
MIEIFHFKVGATIIKLNATVTNLNVQGNLMCHCRRENNMGKIHICCCLHCGATPMSIPLEHTMHTLCVIHECHVLLRAEPSVISSVDAMSLLLFFCH